MTDTVAQILKEVRDALLIAQSRGLHESYFADFAEASEIQREEAQITMALAKLDRLEVVSDGEIMASAINKTGSNQRYYNGFMDGVAHAAALGAVVKVRGE